MNKDTVYRQDVIDALIPLPGIGRRAIEYAIKALERSEPLQPEIIKCMECKYYEASIACNPWGVCCHKDWVANNIGHTVDETGWCYRAERRRNDI